MATPSYHSVQDHALLVTKLYPPPVQARLVSRPRLMKWLDEGLTRRLTLLSAPPGFGKTTLVVEWLRRQPRPGAWLSLDEEDNDPVRFLTYLIAALQQVDLRIGQSVQPLLGSPQPVRPEALLTALINDIARTAQPFVLVLDDYHTIHTLPIHQQLAFLLGHQPSQMHLIICTREDPPLPISRLRAGGQVTEIRQADLVFTLEEAAEFLNQSMGLRLPADDVSVLQAHTEGWIAGLQLAALSMRGSEDAHAFVQAFNGSDRYILDYLLDEVLQRQSADVQDFLLQTAVLDRFTASLCDAVTGRDDSKHILYALEQANLFIVPLDGSRTWYRYHSLFADLLRHRLATQGTVEAKVLHNRASQWYVTNGFPVDAVRHALAAQDWQRAVDLIYEQCSLMLQRGEVATLLRWIGSLPDEVVRARPGLCLNYSWALILTGQLDAAESYLRQAEEVVRDKAPLLGDIVAAQAFIARTRGDDRRTIELSQQALSLWPQDNLAGRSAVAVNLGIAQWNSGYLKEAEQALTEAYQAAQQSGNVYAKLMAIGFLGMIQATWGRLHRAAELFQQAIRSGGQLPPVALIYNELGALYYEWNDLKAAADHLQRGIELGQHSGNLEIQMGGYRTLARLKQAQGDAPAALDALQKAHQLAREKDVPPHERIRNAACHVQIALAQGDLATAIHWAQQVTDEADASPFYPLLGLTQARLLLAQNQKAAAAEQLAARHAKAVQAGWQYGVIETRALQALAAPTFAIALAFLADALTLAQPQGFIRTFVDKGEPMAEMLRQAAAQSIAPDYVAQLLAAFETEAQERRRPAKVPVPPTQPLVEPLSERELEVLQLLLEGRSYHEIAQVLFISVNTVKSHFRSIYGKLGVHNRREARTKAKELNLLP